VTLGQCPALGQEHVVQGLRGRVVGGHVDPQT